MIVKAVESLGSTALILVIIWKLTDRWAGKFLETTAKFLEVGVSQANAAGQQAQAMVTLANAVKDGQGETREVAVVLRVLATKVDELKKLVETRGAQ